MQFSSANFIKFFFANFCSRERGMVSKQLFWNPRTPIVNCVTFLRGPQLLWPHFSAVLWSSSEHLRDPSKDCYTLLPKVTACEWERKEQRLSWLVWMQPTQATEMFLEFMVRLHDFVLVQFLWIFKIFKFCSSFSCELFPSISFDDQP